MKNKNWRPAERKVWPQQRADTRSRMKQQLEKKSVCPRDFPESTRYSRMGVCKRCHVAMRDQEPGAPRGEFYHPEIDTKTGKKWKCVNAGLFFTAEHMEIMPFLRKAARRRYRRMGIRP